jgi:uncharacterized MAPEG superfamily protein
MTTDLWMLFFSVVLTWLFILGSSTPTLLANLKWALGPRDEVIVPPGGWAARFRRTSANMNENLPIFAALVLLVHVAGKANATSALGAQIFFWARVVHAGFYVAGISYIRTLVWCVSIVGMAMVALALF